VFVRDWKGADMPEEDIVNHPKHYELLKPEPIEVIENWRLNFFAGNVLKYLARYRFKGTPITDLEKARWYLDRLIGNLKKQYGEGKGAL